MTEIGIHINDMIEKLREERRKKADAYDSTIGMKPSEFDDVMQSLKDMIADVDTLKEQGFSREEIETHLAFQVIEDDLKKTKLTKRKQRALDIITQLKENLAKQGIDTGRLETLWDSRIVAIQSKKKKEKVVPQLQQDCIRIYFELEKRAGNSIVTSKNYGVETTFSKASKFCSKHLNELKEFVSQTLDDEPKIP